MLISFVRHDVACFSRRRLSQEIWIAEDIVEGSILYTECRLIFLTPIVALYLLL